MDELELQKEETFFEGYKRAVALCLNYMHRTHDIWCSRRFPKMLTQVQLVKSEPRYEKTQHALIQQITKSMQLVDRKDLPSIIAELKDNLSIMAQQSAEDRKEYIKGLLQPFAELSEAFFPYNRIKELQKEAQDAGASREETEKIYDEIDHIIFMAEEYRDVLNSSNKKECPEHDLLVLTTISHIYAKHLDRLLRATLRSKADENIETYQDVVAIYLQQKKDSAIISGNMYSPYQDALMFAELPYDRELEDDLEAEMNRPVKKEQQETTPQNAEVTLPKALQNEKAQYIFKEAKEAGLINEEYDWLNSKQLCVYFSNKMSHFLELTMARVSKNRRELQTAWRPFEQLFGYSNMRIDNNHIIQFGNPLNSDKVDKIFDKAEVKFKTS